MDKKNIKDYIFLLSKLYGILFVTVVIPINIIISIISGLLNGNIFNFLVSNTLSITGAFLFLGIMIYTIIGLIYLFYMINRRFSRIKTDIYTRELPKYFPPAIASLLLDLSIETTTDYTATIAYLISKKYIKLSENNKKIEVISKNPTFQSQHEDYVFQCITNQKKFDPNEFRKLIIYDAKEMGFVSDGKRKIHFFRNFVLAIFVTFLFSLLVEHTKIVLLRNFLNVCYIISGFSIFAIVGYSIYLLGKYEHENIYRTKNGNIEAKKWTGLKKYLKNYTLIANRNLSDIILFEDYIPYAISLNEAKSIEKFIENNSTYRTLIYGKINSFNNI